MFTTLHHQKQVPGRRTGFTILEVLLALALFGLMSLGLSRAVQMIGRGAVTAGKEVRMIRTLESLLTEASKASRFEEEVLDIGEQDGVRYEKVVEELVDFENMDGQILQNMWHVKIIASYEQQGEIVERVAETYRYEPLYQPNR